MRGSGIASGRDRRDQHDEARLAQMEHEAIRRGEAKEPPRSLSAAPVHHAIGDKELVEHHLNRSAGYAYARARQDGPCICLCIAVYSPPPPANRPDTGLSERGLSTTLSACVSNGCSSPFTSFARRRLRERLHYPALRRIHPVLHLDPVPRPAALIHSGGLI
jgi:hypothetical protein